MRKIQTMLTRKFIVVFISSLVISSGRSFEPPEGSGDFYMPYGESLFLTNYIEEGEIKRARQLSKCGDLPYAPPVESYSGFITVNKLYNSNIFFWFFPATNKDPNAPVMLWLQGGPGQTGLIGVFMEHGPYQFVPNMGMVLREYYWAQEINMIYVDNPVGAGFSFTENERGYVTTQDEMADDMYEFLRQFFLIFEELRDNDFYIAGESYGGKYAPCLAHKIHSMGESSHVKLTGIIIGSGFCDPEKIVQHYSDHMYNIGLLDENEAVYIKNISDFLVDEIRRGNFTEKLHNIWSKILDNINHFSGVNKDNFLQPIGKKSRWEETLFHMGRYMDIPFFKRALHLGNIETNGFSFVYQALKNDYMKSIKPNLTVVMDNYKVLIYHGQLDVLIPYTYLSNFLKSINWKFADEYKFVRRKKWHLKNSSGEVAGYFHNIGDFYEVLVRNGGHYLPHDQPKSASDLILRFVKNEDFL